MKTFLKLILLLTLINVFIKANGQNTTSWSLGDSLMDIGHYEKAIFEYRKIINSNQKENFTFKDIYWYNLSCCYSLAGNLDSGISSLLNSGFVESDFGFIYDIDLFNLHNHKDWQLLLKKNKSSFYSKNKNLPFLDIAYKLMVMKSADQGIRGSVDRLRYKSKIDYYLDKQDSIDKLNVIELISIINEIGWPTIDLVGKKASNAAFLIIQHADLNMQKKYFPLVESAYKINKINPQNYAFLFDRILVFEGNLQIYGTQIDIYHGEPKPHPVIDPENLNKRRQAMGMEPIEDYLSYYKEFK